MAPDQILTSLLAIAWTCALGGCATPAGDSQMIDAFATAHGMERTLTTGARFQHVIYARGDLAAALRIHVYLEGDGHPWETRHRIASDPTPRNPLALQLMAQDPTPAIYVGRPCYHGLSRALGCTPWLWTHGRYSREVVASMALAIEHRLPPDDRRHITLIGYSGGGVLATLIAGRLADVDSLVTIAANLDIDAWADRHGYSRLAGSLNPAAETPLDSGIRQIHLIGERDDQVPPETIRRFLAMNPQAHLKVFPEFDHRCCWGERWQTMLGSVELPSYPDHRHAEIVLPSDRAQGQAGTAE